MEKIWHGGVSFDDGNQLEGLTLRNCNGQGDSYISNTARLKFLSIVETARIPLHLFCGPPHIVESCNPGTRSWVFDILFRIDYVHDVPSTAWWDTAQVDSPLGILLEIAHDRHTAEKGHARPKATELLLYACRSRHPSLERSGATPSIFSGCAGSTVSDCTVYAAPLNSDAWRVYENAQTPTPPTSPTSLSNPVECGDAVFLSPERCTSPNPTAVVNWPLVRKRKSVVEAFDEATERRRKARRQGGEGVAAAAASQNRSISNSGSLNSHSLLQDFKHHRRSLSGAGPSGINRVSSVGSTRPSPAPASTSSERPPRTKTEPPTTSETISLYRKPTALAISDVEPDDACASPVPASPTFLHSGGSGPPAAAVDYATRNQHMISRAVMAGMRLHGIRQGNSRTSESTSHDPSNPSDCSRETYKQVYHQTYKSACFTFRAQMSQISLAAEPGCADSLQRVVDVLLGLFVGDPLQVNAMKSEGQH